MSIPRFNGFRDDRIPQHQPPLQRTESSDGRKARKKLYNSAAWQRCRALAIRRTPLCPTCAANGVCEPATEVHHIRDLADGGAPFDLMNLQPLCKTHHSMITSRRMNRNHDGQA